MKDHGKCPCFETCVISNILKSIEVPEVLRYCVGNYRNCRYLPPDFRVRSGGERRETAEV